MNAFNSNANVFVIFHFPNSSRRGILPLPCLVSFKNSVNEKGERSLTLARINRRMLRHRNMHSVFCFLDFRFVDFFNWLRLGGGIKKESDRL